MLTLIFLVRTLIDFYITVFILRVWMQLVHCDFYNPFSQCIIKITQPIIKKISKIIPIIKSWDISSLIVSIFLCIIKFPLLTVIEIKITLFNSYYILIGLLTLLKTIGELMFFIIIMRSLFNLISPGLSPVDSILYQLTEPVIYRIRCIFPSIGNIDFSIMIVIIILYALNYLGMDIFPEIWYRL